MPITFNQTLRENMGVWTSNSTNSIYRARHQQAGGLAEDGMESPTRLGDLVDSNNASIPVRARLQVSLVRPKR